MEVVPLDVPTGLQRMLAARAWPIARVVRASALPFALRVATGYTCGTPVSNIPFEKLTLDNGLRVILHHDPSSPLIAVDIWYHVGSKDEQPGRTGFAHLFEHLMFMGSAHAPYPARPATTARTITRSGRPISSRRSCGSRPIGWRPCPW